MMSGSKALSFLILLLILLVKANEDIDSMDKDDVEFNLLEESKHNNRARWSYLPLFVEHLCADKCKGYGKPFGKLIGARCQCLCPLNAGDLNLCQRGGGAKNCFNFCQGLGYKSGSCLYNSNCFCFCGLSQSYDINAVYSSSTESSKTTSTSTQTISKMDE